MPLDWSPLLEAVREHDRFLLLTHVRPDCDALGSQLGLAEALRQKGKAVRIVIVGPVPPRYEFLDARREVDTFAEDDPTFAEADCAVVLDTGTWNQLGPAGPFLRELGAAKMVIDHHPTQDDLGATRLVDTSAEATGRLVRQAFAALDVPVTPLAATALFAALATDTGWFRHANTRPESFELAAELARAGADPHKLYEKLYESNPPERLKLMGIAIDRLRTAAGGRLVWTELHQRDFELTGIDPTESRDLIDYPRSVAGVEVAMVLIERPGGRVKISLRSRDAVDVGSFAEKFGGGGHRLAAGAMAAGTVEEVRNRVVAELTPLLP